jgi:hypothetical protein
MCTGKQRSETLTTRAPKALRDNNTCHWHCKRIREDIMGKTKEVPRYKVVSMRVSDEEQKSLQELASELSINISDMMRSALHLYARSRETSSGMGLYR